MQQAIRTTLDSISVIIPVFNAMEFLPDAIESIFKQTILPMEIIVINDGSTDKTAEICKTYRNKIRYFHQKNRGPSAARNLGIKQSQGKFIFFLDADDILLPDSLQLLKKSFAEQPEKMVSIGLYQEIIKKGTVWENYKDPYRGAYLSAVMFRREIIEKVGMLNENMNIGEDIDWFFRVREQQIPIAYLEQIVLLYRRHKGNASNDRKNAHKGLLWACRDSLNRRRLGGLANSLEIFGPQSLK